MMWHELLVAKAVRQDDFRKAEDDRKKR